MTGVAYIPPPQSETGVENRQKLRDTNNIAVSNKDVRLLSSADGTVVRKLVRFATCPHGPGIPIRPQPRTQKQLAACPSPLSSPPRSSKAFSLNRTPSPLQLIHLRSSGRACFTHLPGALQTPLRLTDPRDYQGIPAADGNSRGNPRS